MDSSNRRIKTQSPPSDPAVMQRRARDLVMVAIEPFIKVQGGHEEYKGDNKLELRICAMLEHFPAAWYTKIAVILTGAFCSGVFKDRGSEKEGVAMFIKALEKLEKFGKETVRPALPQIMNLVAVDQEGNGFIMVVDGWFEKMIIETVTGHSS